MFFTIIVYNILDSYQTILLLSLGAIEVNPILNYFIIKFNTVHVIWFIKFFPCTLLGIGLFKYQKTL